MSKRFTRAERARRTLVGPYFPDDDELQVVIPMIAGPMILFGTIKAAPDVIVALGKNRAVVVKTDWFMWKVRRKLWEGDLEDLRYRERIWTVQLVASGEDLNAFLRSGPNRKLLMEHLQPA